MATLTYTITVPDESKDAIIDAVCYSNKYRDEVTNEEDEVISNPQSKEDFISECILNWFKSHNKAYEVEKSLNDARDKSISDADAVSIT